MSNPVFNEESFEAASQNFGGQAPTPGKPVGVRPAAGTHVATAAGHRRPGLGLAEGDDHQRHHHGVAGAARPPARLRRRSDGPPRAGPTLDNEGRRDLPVPADGLPRHHRRLRRRHRRDAQAEPRQDPRPGVRPRLRLRRRRDLQGLRDVLQRHRGAGRARHGVGVRRDARALPHPHHQGHRQVPSGRHLRHARRDGALPRLVRHQPVRRDRCRS